MLKEESVDLQNTILVLNDIGLLSKQLVDKYSELEKTHNFFNVDLETHVKLSKMKKKLEKEVERIEFLIKNLPKEEK